MCYCASYSLDGTNTQIKHFKDQNRTIDDQFEHLEKKNRILGNKGFFFIQSYSLSQHPGLVMCHWRQVMVIAVVTVGLESTTQQFHTLSKWKKCFSHTNTLRLRLKKTTWNEIWMKNTTDVHVNLSFCILHCNGKQWRMFCLWVSVCLILFYLKYVLLTHSSPVRCTPSFNVFMSTLHWPQHVSVHLLHVSCFKVLSQRNHVTLSMSLWMNGESFYKHGWISHSSSGHLCWFWTGVKIGTGKTSADITNTFCPSLWWTTAFDCWGTTETWIVHKVSKGFAYSIELEAWRLIGGKYIYLY